MQFRMREVQEDTPPFVLTGQLVFPDLVSGNVDVEQTSPVDAKVVAHRDKDLVHVDGQLDVNVGYRCSRCLELFEKHHQIPFHESFTEQSSQADDDDIHFVSDTVLLDPLVHESVQLTLDYRPLCQENCKGLCVQCGKNLNDGVCACSNETIDPRLEALKDLLSGPETE